MAMRIFASTVFRVKRRSRSDGWRPLGLVVMASGIAAGLLRPRRKAIKPARLDPASYFTPEEIERGRGFARPQLALGLGSEAAQLALLATLVNRLARGRGARRRPRPILEEAGAGALMAAGLVVGGTLSSLPGAALARRRSLAVGLSTQSWSDWLRDLAKAGAIELGLGAGAGAGLVTLTRRLPRAWWLPASAGAVGAGALLGTLGPVLLDPMFNRFTPLPDGETRRDVLELGAQAGIKVGEVYAVDASRRTTAANAYVSGLGPTKRVVLFDTLLERYGREEVRVVVAHELAHVRGRDTLRALGYLALVSPAAALAIQRLSWMLQPERGTSRALPALALASAVVAVPVGIAGGALSRAVERRADAFSLEATQAPDAFVSFQRAIAVQNLADVSPPRWISHLLATHPPTMARIGAAVAYSDSSSPSEPSNSGRFLMPSRVSHLE
jgi:STE24 endopeptidase